jgi:hypothetical protein
LAVVHALLAGRALRTSFGFWAECFKAIADLVSERAHFTGFYLAHHPYFLSVDHRSGHAQALGWPAAMATMQKASAVNIPCVQGEGDALWEALSLSLRSAIVFANFERSESAKRAYLCLYGFDAQTSQPRLPVEVSNTFLLQSVTSGMLIFFVLLALRNMLRAH